jgi:hypothetical protein
MILLRILGLSVLVGCAVAMLVWFGSGLIMNAVSRSRPGGDEPGGDASKGGEKA